MVGSRLRSGEFLRQELNHFCKRFRLFWGRVRVMGVVDGWTARVEWSRRPWARERMCEWRRRMESRRIQGKLG